MFLKVFLISCCVRCLFLHPVQLLGHNCQPLPMGRREQPCTATSVGSMSSLRGARDNRTKDVKASELLGLFDVSLPETWPLNVAVD